MEKKSRPTHRTPCPQCREHGADRRGDNLVHYNDGHAYCYRCGLLEKDLTDGQECVTLTLSNTIGNIINNNNKYITKDNTLSMTKEYLPWRGVNKSTMKAYDVSTEIAADGKPTRVVYPYGGGYVKYRLLDEKSFYYGGTPSESTVRLFGQERFSAGMSRSVTITEGELDCLSVFQMLGSKYPCVSVRGSKSAEEDCAASYSWLNSFEKIYLCFDNDEPGQTAAKEVARLFDVNKIYHVKLTKHKDPNDYLRSQDEKEFSQVWWNSRPFMPKGIVADYETIESILQKQDRTAAASYPFPTLELLTYGIRLGELVLFTAQEKVGKTEVLRAIEYHLLTTTDENIGVIHLEEGEKRSVLGLIGYHLGVPAHLPDTPLSMEQQIQAYKDLTRKDGRLHIYSHFGSDDPNTILDVIRYLVSVCKCKFITLDHITMLVTGFKEDDERKTLDYISTRLAMSTRDLDYTLFLVSHVNDDGKTRGSRNISKVADLIVHLDRDIEAATFEQRNKTFLTVRGNRYAGQTGPAGVLWFDPKRFRIEEMTVDTDTKSWDTAGF